RTRLRSVCHETVCRIGLVQDVREGVTLQRVQPRFAEVGLNHMVDRLIHHRRPASAAHPITSAMATRAPPLSMYGAFICQMKSAPPTRGPLACPRLFAAFWAPSAVPARRLPPRVEITAARLGEMNAIPRASTPTSAKTDAIPRGIIRTARLVPIRAKPIPIWVSSATRPARKPLAPT